MSIQIAKTTISITPIVEYANVFANESFMQSRDCYVRGLLQSTMKDVCIHHDSVAMLVSHALKPELSIDYDSLRDLFRIIWLTHVDTFAPLEDTPNDDELKYSRAARTHVLAITADREYFPASCDWNPNSFDALMNGSFQRSRGSIHPIHSMNTARSPGDPEWRMLYDIINILSRGYCTLAKLILKSWQAYEASWHKKILISLSKNQISDSEKFKALAAENERLQAQIDEDRLEIQQLKAKLDSVERKFAPELIEYDYDEISSRLDPIRDELKMMQRVFGRAVRLRYMAPVAIAVPLK